MRQRILGVGGEFEIGRTHPQGTRVYVRVPLAATMPVDQRADQSQGVD
jgi:signal transduction histidine kinase